MLEKADLWIKQKVVKHGAIVTGIAFALLAMAIYIPVFGWNEYLGAAFVMNTIINIAFFWTAKKDFEKELGNDS